MADIDECYESVDSLEPPKNLDIPFLTYGFYKPDQLSFTQIKKYTNKKIRPVEIEAKLKHVNGMPVLVNEYDERDKKVKGYIIRFRKNKRRVAYKTISKGKDMHIYKWDEMEIDGERVNVLVGANPKILNNVINDPNVPDSLRNWYDYDWKYDPVYKNALMFIDSRFGYLNSKLSIMEDHNTTSYEVALLFVEVQSLYMVLWSALDRFTTFRYGSKTKKENILKLSEEQFFKDSLIERVETSHTVTSAQNLKQITLDPYAPSCAALYYYQLRNNVVHSGKMNVNEVKKLFDALSELILIFEDVLDGVEKERQKLELQFRQIL